MPANRIQELFGGGDERERTPSGRQLELEALLPEYAARLTRKGVTVKSLFEEYAWEHPKHLTIGISSDDNETVTFVEQGKAWICKQEALNQRELDLFGEESVQKRNELDTTAQVLSQYQ